MNDLQKAGGTSAIFQALIYLSAFVYFGVFWDFPSGADNLQKFDYLANNQTVQTMVNLTMYVLFGVLLAILVLALHQRLKSKTPALSHFASIFGIIWVGLVIASGMISNIGLGVALELSSTDAEQAMIVWITINTLVEGLGGGNEVVGGLWVLFIGIACLKVNELPKSLSYFSLFIGVAGISTIYPADVLTEIFGLGQIVWFIWLGFIMIKNAEKVS